MGRQWYEDGKMFKKKNTFTDFINCAEHLVGEQFTTPEHLFAAAYAACFHSSLLSAAESAHVNIKGSSVSARIDWIDYENGNDGFRVELRAALPGVGAAEGKKLLNQAHGSCPYSRALRHNVPVIVRLD